MSKGQEIPVNMPQEMQSGVYANNMLVTHNKEEFVMDFIFMDPQMGSVVSRVVSSPGHMKRIVKAFEENVKKYEMRFGKIEESPAPKGKLIGFNPPETNQ